MACLLLRGLRSAGRRAFSYHSTPSPSALPFHNCYFSSPSPLRNFSAASASPAFSASAAAGSSLDPRRLRNVAVIAHVDHGKTTLMDRLLRQCGADIPHERAMDSISLERERGITIASKVTSISWNDIELNMVDTPGHADFGGEVERVVGMVEGAVLVVDAGEGPLAQTKFVLAKALKYGLRPILLLNKVDRPSVSEETCNEVESLVFDLFANLGATEEQLDFPVLYASAKEGWASLTYTKTPADDTRNMSALLNAIIQHVPFPSSSLDAPFQMLVSMMERDFYLGRILTGRVSSGVINVGDRIHGLRNASGVEKIEEGKVTKLMKKKGTNVVPIDSAGAGDIISIAGLASPSIGHTVASVEVMTALPTVELDPPTISMTFSVNDSPVAGHDGTHLTGGKIGDRLLAEAETNLAINVIPGASESFEVQGRGELQLGILIENMRREGFELSVSPPRVMYKTENGEKLEPIEEVTIEVNEEHVGLVMEALSHRRGEVVDMGPVPGNVGRTRMSLTCPSRGLVGYRSVFSTDTRGNGFMHRAFLTYSKYKGPLGNVRKGVLVSVGRGLITAHALMSLEARGTLFVSPEIETYDGMIVGENSRDAYLDVNPVRTKELTNIRAPGKDENVRLSPPRLMTLEEAIGYVASDELIEASSPFSDIVGSIYSKFSSMDVNASETSTPELINWDKATMLRIRNIAERLNTTASNVSEALSLTKLANEASHGAIRQRTTSILHARVFGREAEAEAIVGQLLLNEGRDDSMGPSILPIVGVAGIGKTTVARLVYNHPTIRDTFRLRMWVSISLGIDEVRITKEIIESASADGGGCFLTNFNILQVMLQEKIKGKRFLLVLDDVWCDETAVERERWERLLAPLRVGDSCSRILVTTRMVGTAQMLGSVEPAIFLQGLRDHDFWSLMKASESQDVDANDEDMKSYRLGKRIAKRFSGSPLAAKAAAVLLRDDYEAVEEWNHNLESNRIWENMMPILELDYRQLSGHLQRCFAYCGLFPSEWKFRNDELLHLWMAQGYISPHDANRATRMEDAGKEYLDNLVLKSFLEMHRKEFITYYQMNNLLHLLAQSVSVDECYRIENDEQANIPITVRHISLCTDAVSCLNSQVAALANLRSLIFFKGIQDDAGISILRDVLKELKSIRALDISHCKIQMLPDEVGRCCIYLRYLNLSFTSIQTLPESLCRLHHLQVLNLQGCGLHSLPSGMSKLVNLRHLIASNQLIAKIRGIGSLTYLQQLQMFQVRKEEGYQIDQLKGLKEIRGLLQIRNLENLESKSEASKAALHNKKHIEMLQLMWDFVHVISPIHSGGEEVIEALCPHPSLKRLDITGYKGTRSPSWMKNTFLSNVVILYLCNCPKWECFPPLGQLPSLRVLWLKGMHSIKKVGPELYGNTDKVFQCLQELVLDDMQGLEDWWRDDKMLSSLCNVIIKDCTKLKGLPLYPQKITELTLARKGHWLPYYDEYRRVQISKVTSSLCIYNCPLIIAGFSTLENDLAMVISSLKSLTIDNVSVLATPLLERSLSCLKCLDIQDCQGIVSFTAREEQVFSLLSSLQSLSISGCTELRSLPMELRNLTSLENLVVINCPAIQSLPENGLPLSLRALEITSCHPLLKERCRKENGDDWHRISYIPRIEIDGEIIPIQ